MPHPKLLCTDEEHALRYLFTSVRYKWFGCPSDGGSRHSLNDARIVSSVLTIVMVCDWGWPKHGKENSVTTVKTLLSRSDNVIDVINVVTKIMSYCF